MADQKRRASRWRRAVVIAALAVVVGITLAGRRQPLRPDGSHKVMVFPLVDRIAGRPGSNAGEEVAIMIGSGLEHTEPLKWIDGWAWMDPAQRENTRLFTAGSARSLSQRQRARFYIDGSIVGTGDSATVVLRLNDARTDSVLIQASASGTTDPTLFPQLGLRAMVQLLPALVAPGRAIDQSALSALNERRPAAVADWLQGEREYRRSHFRAALGFLRRAVRMDSTFAIAALRGAQAASWLNLDEEANALLGVASAHKSVLPGKYVQYALGLRDYFTGEADSAVARFRQVLAIDSTWAPAWMSLGEAYFHLFPHASPLDSLAENAFTMARRNDPDFSTPMYHLAEIALRGEKTSGARV